jgi:CheY-like chemotaxis protein
MTVLVADGDPGAELVVRALLEPAGYSVEVARTGNEAAARLAEGPWRAVVLDGALSADGKRLLADDVAAQPGLRLFVATADAGLGERCRAMGARVLPRPFLPRDLVAQAGDLLNP